MVAIAKSVAWAPCQHGGRTRRRRQPALAVRAGLLDLIRGVGSAPPGLPEDPEGTALLRWLEERGLPPQKVAAVAVPGAGRGLAATQAIPQGELLLRLPSQLVITPAAAARQSSLAPLLESTPLPAWSVLALWLAEARAAGPAGEWWPYVSLLPGRTGSVLEWSEEEVGWLAGSHLAQAAAEIRSAAEASWREMQPLLAAAEQAGLGPAGAFSREALQWAFGILLSRLVRLPSLAPAPAASGRQQQQAAQQAVRQPGGEPPGTEALLPWADLLNHAPASTAFLDWDAANAAVVLRADRRYRQGEEVHISYGQKTSGELLLSYGFAPKPADNPHDGCKLRLALRPGDPAADAKAAALAAFGMAPSELFPLRMAAAPFGLVHYAALAAAEVCGSEEAAQLAQQLFGAGDIPPALQRPALEAVVAACQAAMKGYPSSLEAARDELAKLEAEEAAEAAAGQRQQGGNNAARQRRQLRRQVLQVVVYERQVLARTAFVLQQELKDLRRMAGR